MFFFTHKRPKAALLIKVAINFTAAWWRYTNARMRYVRLPRTQTVLINEQRLLSYMKVKRSTYFCVFCCRAA